MHQYLSAIGFRNVRTLKQWNSIIEQVKNNPDSREYITLYPEMEESPLLTEYRITVGENMGIAVVGEYDEENEFFFDHAFPYLSGTGLTSREEVNVDRHGEHYVYSGICDDANVGVILIFYLENSISYIRRRGGLTESNSAIVEKYVGPMGREGNPAGNSGIVLAGLSVNGMIMMPIGKNATDRARLKNADTKRSRLVAAARSGDEEAMESLTLEDMDTYTTLSKRILKEDVFSLVDTYFMPYGAQSDQYSVLGEIVAFHYVTNTYTGERVVQMKISCNGLLFDICINRDDLLGEPEIGRRFKGCIWLMGRILFPE